MGIPKLTKPPGHIRTAADAIRWLTAGGQSRRLSLSYPLHWTDAELTSLMSTSQLPRITALAMRGNFGIEGMRALATCPRLDRLTWLDLSYSTIAGQSLRELTTSLHLTRLCALNPCRTRVGDVGAEALAAAPNLVTLQTLDLSWCDIGDRGAEALAASAYLANLTKLDLRGNDIGPSGMEALLARWPVDSQR